MWNSLDIQLGESRSLHAVQMGGGADFVLIHGALTTHHDWLCGPAGPLAELGRVTIVDRPGHGASRRPRFFGTPRDQAGQIAAGLAKLAIGPATIVAHSFGALVALALAECHPERVEALVLAAPLAFPEPRLLEHSLFAPRALPLAGPLLSRAANVLRLDRMMLENVQAQMFAPEPVPAEWRRTFPYDAVLDPDAMVSEGEDAAAILPMSPAGTIDLARIRVPVAVLAGTRDRIVSHARQGGQLAGLLPRAELVEIEDAGHMLHHTHPAALLSAVESLAAA